MINGNAVGGITGYGKTFILTDENGNEITGVLVDEEVIFTADPIKDIRKGKVAATDTGIVIGQKEIPAYHTTKGQVAIPVGKSFTITGVTKYNYTQLQALICQFNTSVSNSVATEKVVIDDNVYDVSSTVSLSNVTVDDEAKSINLGITNNGNRPCILRFFTYKEEY